MNKSLKLLAALFLAILAIGVIALVLSVVKLPDNVGTTIYCAAAIVILFLTSKGL